MAAPPASCESERRNVPHAVENHVLGGVALSLDVRARTASVFLMWPQPSIPRFAPDIEAQFQASYYARIRSTLRLVAPFMVALLLVHLAVVVRRPTAYDLAVALPQLGFWSLIFGLTRKPSLERHWQPVFVALGWLLAALVLWRLAPLLTADIARMREAGRNVPTNPQQKFYFMLQFAVLMVSFTALQLQFRWAALLYGGVTAIGIAAFLSGLPSAPLFRDVRFAFLPGVLIGCVLMLTAFVLERLARSSFEANRHLAILQAAEHRKRVETEKMLHVLNGAIGAIVHDLGGPLARVQSGSGLLERLLREGGSDPDTLLKFNDMVSRGSQMLNVLRLSLIEQSRVLEGKPTPVDLRPVGVRAIAEAGASFQQPRVTQGHAVSLEGQDFTICADEMKMVTVLMNLIGNALKYSDGQVRVTWREHQSLLLLAVLDEGKEGRGLTREQCARLFTPFGRLDAHAEIEGTGLGLLSVQKIVAAHGGEVWIEGFEDGTHGSVRFSTARDNCPATLGAPFHTAFVMTCPLDASTLG